MPILVSCSWCGFRFQDMEACPGGFTDCPRCRRMVQVPHGVAAEPASPSAGPLPTQDYLPAAGGTAIMPELGAGGPMADWQAPGLPPQQPAAYEPAGSGHYQYLNNQVSTHVHFEMPRAGVNHAFHFIMTLCTCGCWLPVWILAAILDSMRPGRGGY